MTFRDERGNQSTRSFDMTTDRGMDRLIEGFNGDENGTAVDTQSAIYQYMMEKGLFDFKEQTMQTGDGGFTQISVATLPNNAKTRQALKQFAELDTTKSI